VRLYTFSFLDVENRTDLLVGLEGQVLHFGGDEGVMVSEGKVVGFGFEDEVGKVVF
jgi:hypothetical protein